MFELSIAVLCGMISGTISIVRSNMYKEICFFLLVMEENYIVYDIDAKKTVVSIHFLLQ